MNVILQVCTQHFIACSFSTISRTLSQKLPTPQQSQNNRISSVEKLPSFPAVLSWASMHSAHVQYLDKPHPFDCIAP